MVESEKPIKNIDNYTLLSTILDSNSRGKVHKAVSKDKNSFFELIILPKEQFKGKVSLLEEMQGDIRKLKLLEHPNILRFISLIETPNTYYLCSEITNEGTLSDYIVKQKALSENESFEIFVQIFDGYKEFLRRGVIHANLSTKSIYKANRMFKISSLFLKKNQRDFASPHKLCFLSPEALDSDTIEQSYDCWSLGVIFCEMIFGGLPFKAENIQELRKCHDYMIEILSELAKRCELSNECFSFIKGFFQKKSKQRFYWNEIAKHPFFELNKERVEVYLLENLHDHIHETKQKHLVEDLMNDKLNIFRKDVLEAFEKSPNEFGYYCFIYKRIIQSMSLFSKLQRKSSLEEEMGNFDLDEGGDKHSIPKSLSDLDKFLVRSLSLSPVRSKKKSFFPPVTTTTNMSNTGPKNMDPLNLVPVEIPIEEAKSQEIKGDNIYPEEEDYVEPISAKLEVTFIDLQKINAEYKQSKKKKLSVILENSVEVSSVISKDVNAMNVFEEIMKEMIYFYMHEKEIIEFLLNVSKELQQDIGDLQFTSLNSFMIAKFAMLRMVCLIENVKKEVNIFKLIYWEQLLKSPVYGNLTAIIDENKPIYLKYLNDYYKKAMLVKENETFLKKELIDTDVSLKDSESFLKVFVNLMGNSFELLTKKAKSVEQQNRTQGLKHSKMALKLIFIGKMAKILGASTWDLMDGFDLGLFKEKLMNMPLKDVESLSLKIKKEI